MRFLPEELILGILSSVPTRSVMRLKLICKSWDKLISDPFFARIHSRAPIAAGFFSIQSVGRRRYSYGKRYIYGQDADDEHVPSYRSFTGHVPAMVTTLVSEGYVANASCNGLICFHKDSRLLICDPITGTSATIDDSTVHLPHPPPHLMASVHDVQLLYDPKVSADFKITKLWFLWTGHLEVSVLFHVFSSRDGSWKASSQHGPYPDDIWPEYVVSTSVGEEGAVCWLEPYGCTLRVYDIGADSLWEMQTPPLDVRDQTTCVETLIMRSVSGRSVYLMMELRNKFVLWRLEGKEKRWVLEFEGIKRSPVSTSTLKYPLSYDAEEQKVTMHGRKNVETYHLSSSKREVIAQGVDFMRTNDEPTTSRAPRPHQPNHEDFSQFWFL